MRRTPTRVAVLGFGTSGRIFHAPYLAANPDYEISAIVTRSLERRAAASAEYPQARVLSSADEVWQRADEFDLAVIGTPNGSHEALAAEALDLGLHVVVDKPAALTAAGVRSLAAAAQQRGLILTVFQNRRWDGDFLTLRQLIADGALGEIRRFESRFEWWKPHRRDSWKDSSDRSAGGGILYDLGSHLIDQALQLFGPVTGVYAELDRRRAGAVAEDDAFLALTHASGVRAHLWMSAVAPSPAPRFHVLGAEGGYTSWGLDGQEPALLAGARPGDEGFGVTPEERWGELGAGSERRRIPTVQGHYGVFYQRLADSLRTGGPPPVDPEEAADALEIIEQAFANSRAA